MQKVNILQQSAPTNFDIESCFNDYVESFDELYAPVYNNDHDHEPQLSTDVPEAVYISRVPPIKNHFRRFSSIYLKLRIFANLKLEIYVSGPPFVSSATIEN